jgi:hypothetical protein
VAAVVAGAARDRRGPDRRPVAARQRLLVAALTVCVAGLAPAASHASPRSPSQGPGVAVERIARSAERVTEYWTPARMRHAIPLTVEAHAAAQASASAGGAASSRGEPIAIAPAAPEGWEPGTTAAVPGAGPDGGGRKSIPYASVELTDTTSYPNVVHGVIFFRLGKFDYSCSGTVVNAPGHSVVITAGHCVHGGGRGRPWSTNFVFAPGYQDMVTPFGLWPAQRLFTTKLWRKRSRFSSDVGAAAMSPNAAGQSVESVVGARGIAFNQPREQAYRSFGYPVAPTPKYDGESLWVCDSMFGMVDPYPERKGPPQSGIGCDMGAGSSGGGWVVGDQYVNSVNSFGYAFLPEIVFGTYFGDAAAQVYLRAVAG